MTLDLFEGRTGRRGRMGRMGEKRKRGSPFFRTPSSPIRPILPLLPVLPSNMSRAMLRCQINRLNKTDVKEPYSSAGCLIVRKLSLQVNWRVGDSWCSNSMYDVYWLEVTICQRWSMDHPLISKLNSKLESTYFLLGFWTLESVQLRCSKFLHF